MKNKNNNALYASLAVILTAVSFLLAWKLIIPEFQSNKQKVAQLDIDIKYARAKLDSLKLTKSSLFDLGDTVNQILVAMPADKDAPNLITELEAIGNTYSVVIPSIQISDATQASSSEEGAASSSNQVTVSFPAAGKFEDLNKFIATLENDIRFMNINAVSLTSSASEENADAMSLVVTLTAYKHMDTSLSNTSAPVSSNLTTEGR